MGSAAHVGTTRAFRPRRAVGQYCGNGYWKLPRDYEAVRSQNRRGAGSNNAQAENRLKVLGVYGHASKLKYSNCVSNLFLVT
jgi:hypothetical protein